MERITGATTVFLHTPGTKPARGRRSDEVQVEVYASPHTRMTNEEDIAMLAQSFADKIARVHLMSFLQHCKNSAIAPPNKKCTFMSWFMFQIITSLIISVFGTQLSKNPFRLPPQQRDIPGYVLCECLPTKLEISPCPIAATSSPIIISDDDSLPDLDEDKPKNSLSTSRLNHLILIAFLDLPVPGPRPSMDDGFHGAIISVGPETDQVLGYHGIDDDIIPRLRVLSQTVKSSHWKFKLRDPRYKLTTDQAVDIAQAMMNDFMRKPGTGFQKVMLDNFDLCVLSADTSTGINSHTG